MRCNCWLAGRYLLIVLAGPVLLGGRAHAQDAPPPDEVPRNRDVLLSPVHRYPLIGGGAIVHETDGGRVYRVDQTDKEVARAKVPRASMLAHTELVLSRDQSRVLVVHSADRFKWPAKSRTVLLDARTLKQIVEWPLGRCTDVRGADALPAIADTLTLLCQDSRPPGQLHQRPTLAAVALNLPEEKVVAWSAVGGLRHGQWFGPMFFGYTYDTSAVTVETNGKKCPADFVEASTTSSGVRYPCRVIVLERSNGQHKGEIWFLDGFGASPRRVATLAETPTSATICGAASRVLVVRQRLGDAYTSAGSITATYDLATGQLIR